MNITLEKMKQVSIILFLTALIGCSKCQVSGYLGRNVIDTSHILIIIAGESNAGGFALNSEATPEELAPRTNLKILNNTNLLFENLDIETNNLLAHPGMTTNASHGIENELANIADEGDLGNNPVYLVKAGLGGSRIMMWVNPDSAYTPVNGWTQFKTRVDTAVKLVTTANGGVPPKIFLVWTHGINDSIYNYMTSATWKDSTKSMFAQMRTRYGHLPIFITYLPAIYPSYNTQITALGTEVSECYPIQTSDANLRDANHWSYAGWKIIADRIAAKINENYDP